MTFPTVTIVVFILISLGLMVLVVRLRGAEMKAKHELKELQGLYVHMMTPEGHLQIAREQLRILRAREATNGKDTLDLMRIHLKAAGATIEQIGCDAEEYSRLAFYEMVTKPTGISPLAYS